MGCVLEQSGRTIRISADDGSSRVEFQGYESRQLKMHVHGVYGIIKYDSIEYLITISGAKAAGCVSADTVYEVTDVLVSALGNSRSQALISRIRQFFRLGGIYFSEYSLFRRNEARVAVGSVDLADEHEFLFNQVPLRRYREKAPEFGVYCIQGCFSSFKGLCLLSRRSYLRAGVRYFSRGCDAEGNCSNFVETEQFIDGESSYLQLRGSIPLFWSHRLAWKYAPDIVLDRNGKPPGCSADSGFAAAHSRLRRCYPEQIKYVNLIKDTGYEGKMHAEFSAVLGGEDAHHFNFHRDAGRADDLFDIAGTGITRGDSKQQTIVRTNCIDCLDRTNSFQYIVGRRILREQLAKSKLVAAGRADEAEYAHALREMFFKNGNYLSAQYAGTPALLAKHIVGGQLSGCMRDGYYSLKRYFINRFYHGTLQNTYDVMCGRRTSGPLESHSRKIKLSVLGFVVCFLLSKLISGSLGTTELLAMLVIVVACAAMFAHNLFDFPLN
ncbi:phosphatidylinositol 4-phosphatase [Pancytospora philotis]|nr:phosphatidylinositol 4-phosphatase [Pancytospora philotis]